MVPETRREGLRSVATVVISALPSLHHVIMMPIMIWLGIDMMAGSKFIGIFRYVMLPIALVMTIFNVWRHSRHGHNHSQVANWLVRVGTVISLGFIAYALFLPYGVMP